MTRALLACIAATFVVAGAGVAVRARSEQPAPQRDTPDPVLTVLPARVNAPSADPLARARMHLERARASDDPREESYAEAALAPLLAATEPPLPALFLQATLAQRRHDFPRATELLNRILGRQPEHAEARLTLAFVQLATHDTRGAAASCEALAQVTSFYLAEGCRAAVWTRDGHARAAFDHLAALVDADAGLPAEPRAWLSSLRAEAAEALGIDDADACYRHSLELDPSDRYTRATYVDFLLDHARPRDALQLLAAAPAPVDADALVLRRVLAQAALGEDTGALAGIVRGRFEAMAARGDPLHLREEIRFRVAFDPSFTPPQRLAEAQRNYRIQREPWDARVLLEACLAAHDAAPCREAREAYAAYEHPLLRALAARLSTEAP